MTGLIPVLKKLPTDQRVYRVKPVTHLITRIFNRIMGKFLGIIIIRDIHGKFRKNNREFWGNKAHDHYGACSRMRSCTIALGLAFSNRYKYPVLHGAHS